MTGIYGAKKSGTTTLSTIDKVAHNRKSGTGCEEHPA
jgi:hypothetical protein